MTGLNRREMTPGDHIAAILLYTILGILGWVLTGHCNDRIVVSPKVVIYAHRPVKVMLTVEASCESYGIDWRDGSVSQSTDCDRVFIREHLYKEPGEYTITVVVLYHGKRTKLTTLFLLK